MVRENVFEMKTLEKASLIMHSFQSLNTEKLALNFFGLIFS